MAWIRNKPQFLKTFVAKRISEIQLTVIQQWHSVNTTNNIANILSRGSGIDKLFQNNHWWKGPIFLQIDELPDFTSPLVPGFEDSSSELKHNVHIFPVYLNINASNDTIDKIFNCSNNYSKIVRVFSRTWLTLSEAWGAHIISGPPFTK